MCRSASARGGAQKDAQALLPDRPAAVCLGPAAADESAVPDAARLDVRAKCQAEVRDSLLAKDRDFPRAAAACLAGAARPDPDALARRDARERFRTRQPQGVLLKVACLREQRPRAEPVRLLAARRERQDEWVSEREAQPASGQPGLPQVPALAAWEQFSEPHSLRPEALPGELL